VARSNKHYPLDETSLHDSAFKADHYERAFAVANLYLAPIEQQVRKLDAKPAIAVCIVPDDVYVNCRPKSYVSDTSDERKSPAEKNYLSSALSDRKSGQGRFDFGDEPPQLEQNGMSPDFRRQLKARVMQHDLPVQIVRESTLDVTEQVRRGLKGVNPLSDRLWNIGTALFYKCGRKPWKTPWAREGVTSENLS
jgi:hypothetical protein